MLRFMKRLFAGFAVVVIVYPFAIFQITGHCESGDRLKAAEIEITDEFTGTNNDQFRSSVWMGFYKDELYLYPHCSISSKKTVYDGWLCVYRNHSLQKICKLGKSRDVRIISSLDGYIYYWVLGGSNARDELYCYDIERSKETLMFTGKSCWNKGARFENERMVKIPYFAEESGVLSIAKVFRGELKGNEIEEESYTIGEKQYSVIVKRNGLAARVFLANEENQREVLFDAALHRTVIPVQDGLLVHNEGYQSLLYLIDKSNDMVPLFDVECLRSVSAIAVVGDNVFLSLKRFEKFASLGMCRFENDSVEGTYRISLSDYHATKISDQIYDGLFYFGGESMFACDENTGVYVIDEEGNVKYIIL